MRKLINNLKSIYIPAIMLVIGFVSTSAALAQGTPSNNRGEQGLSISPFILERQMDKGQTLNETIEVTNTTNRTLPIDISVNDFVANGDNGQQTFLEPGEGDQTYALSKWLNITNSPKFVLKPSEKTEIQFTITAPQDAEDGGHYGAVVFSFQGAPVSGSAVQVTQKLAAIILVKTGKANENGVIKEFKTKQMLYQKAPITFETIFKNTGNVHVKPRGGITITNMFGKKVGSAVVNPNGNNVLPNSERLFESDWNDKFAFGRYTASMDMVYGDSGTVIKTSTSFWVIPLKLVLGVAVILFIIIFGFTFGIRRYNRWFMSRTMEQTTAKKRTRK